MEMTTATGTARHPHLLTALFARLAELPVAIHEYQRKRAIYIRTLEELESYRPRELADLGISTGDFETLARKQAGF
jgi:uncharacterized protein YjiS (DUF1127 family)